MNILALSGGVGGAKLATGLSHCLPADQLSILVNTGDDAVHYGVLICPDMNTLMFNLADMHDEVQGWGIREDTGFCMDALATFGEDVSFRVTDKNLAFNLLRQHLLTQGLNLTEATSEMAKRLGLKQRILPMCDERVPTLVEIETAEGKPVTLPFHTWFVTEQCRPEVKSLHFNSVEQARLTPGILSAIDQADVLVICPSNPFLSVAPILAVPSMKEHLIRGISQRVVVSPLIAGQAVKGPLAKLMPVFNLPCDSLGIAQYYLGLATHFVLDEQDAALAPAIENLGYRVQIADTLMTSRAKKSRLAEQILQWVADTP